jgi:hypothetical protein
VLFDADLSYICTVEDGKIQQGEDHFPYKNDIMLSIAYDFANEEMERRHPDLHFKSPEYKKIHAKLVKKYEQKFQVSKKAYNFLENLVDTITEEIGTTYEDMESHRKDTPDSLLGLSESEEEVSIRMVGNRALHVVVPNKRRYKIEQQKNTGQTLMVGVVDVDVVVSNPYVESDSADTDAIEYTADLETGRIIDTESLADTGIIQEAFYFSDEFLEELGIDPDDTDEITDFLYDTTTINYPPDSHIENLIKQDINEFKQKFGSTFEEIESKRTQAKDSILDIEESSNPMRKLINVIERASK